MHHTGGPGWRITMDTSGPMLIALYVRDAAGLDTAGHPALCHVAPKIRASDHSHLIAEVGGPAALKTEWEAWWEQLLKAHPEMSPELSPPGFRAFSNSPALRRVLQAHFGAALTWARERRAEYGPSKRSAKPTATTSCWPTWWRTACLTWDGLQRISA